MKLSRMFRQRTSWAGLAVIIGSYATASLPFMTMLQTPEFISALVAGISLILAPEVAADDPSNTAGGN